jgi:homoserine O-succinyltransferase/O-acetyltransferase
MPLILPENLPSIDELKKEQIFISGYNSERQKSLEPLKIAFVNLMPKKVEAETEILRLLSNTPLEVKVDFIKLETHSYKNAPEGHMENFYKNFREIKGQAYDGLIMNGAPVELLPFEEVNYWKEYMSILDWAREKASSSLFICWSAQAALYHYFGIPKYPLPKKMFGVFKHTLNQSNEPIFRGFDDVFYGPHSRHTEIRKEDIIRVNELEILAQSDIAGVNVVKSSKNEFFITGHFEYSLNTLHDEYQRDMNKGLHIDLPCNYYAGQNPINKPVRRWLAHANLLFINWLNYYVSKIIPK